MFIQSSNVSAFLTAPVSHFTSSDYVVWVRWFWSQPRPFGLLGWFGLFVQVWRRHDDIIQRFFALFALSLSLSHSAAHVFRLLLDSNEVEQNSVINQNWLDNEILCEFPAKCLRALALEFTTCHMSPGDIVYHKWVLINWHESLFLRKQQHKARASIMRSCSLCFQRLVFFWRRRSLYSNTQWHIPAVSNSAILERLNRAMVFKAYWITMKRHNTCLARRHRQRIVLPMSEL